MLSVGSSRSSPSGRGPPKGAGQTQQQSEIQRIISIGTQRMAKKTRTIRGKQVDHTMEWAQPDFGTYRSIQYIISTPWEGELDVHISQIKPHYEDPHLPGGVPLHHYHSGSKPIRTTPVAESIVGHSSHTEPYQFLVHWEGTDVCEDTWVSTPDLLIIARGLLTSYLGSKGLLGELVRQFQPPPSSSDGDSS